MTQNAYGLSRRTAIGAIGAAMLVPRAGRAAGLRTLSGSAFGTTWRLSLPEHVDQTPIEGAIDALFRRVDEVFSPWRTDSVLSHFNTQSAGTACRNVELAAVTRSALDIAGQSDGAFDPTVGPLVARWGFGPIHHGGAPDWRGLSSDTDEVRKSHDDLTLDLCGIAKGWALDRAADLVEAHGIRDFLFELGGEFAARGRHPDARPWRIAVEIPPTIAQSQPVLRLPSGAAVATSGTWTQSYRHADNFYSHIIDPGTRMPISGALRSVTVVSETATLADGWATALCAAGAEAGPDLAQSIGLPALFEIETETGLRGVETARMGEFLL
ncbi:FAD:protein FMN transferase [Jannaschia pohangensis]|uniref:FAD:protein FMN transferase n=1 Tax=Jannaschia pohangensis TaxID=390807 RepID=A0A1I3H6S8_9RHOB|nr:FAD:protein FMN transferase [Jannaschia pohangensis]SFI31383.1 thiamine biosynthesis lipoprotein [Jannaschia pohangensis]